MPKKKNMEQRTKIIKTSFSLFIQNGYEKVTTRAIAEKCGMQRALLHHYYAKKETILFEVYLSISEKVVAYLHNTLSDAQMEMLMAGSFFRLYYEMMSIKPLYANIYMNIYENTRLLNTTLSYMFNHPIKFGLGKSLSEQTRLDAFSLCGSLSQLVLLYYNGELNMTPRDVVNYAMKHHYLSLGITPDEAQDRINFVDSFVTKEYVLNFITYLENEMQYTESL
jgi:AcrR family transcriptional regulator